VTHTPVLGVTVTLTDGAGNPLPAVCLLAGQQNQVTNATGAYRFDLVPGAATQCPVGATTYQVKIVNPVGYTAGFSTTIPPQPGSVSVGACPIDAVPGGSCDVSASTSPPPVGSLGTYFVAFVIGSGDPDLVNNHIAIDPVPASFSKVANVSTAKRGETVTYTITADAVPIDPATITDTLPPGLSYIDGTTTVNGTAVTPTTSGNTLTFTGLRPDVGHKIKLVLKVVVNASAQPGNLVNRTQLINPATGDVLGNAKAAVELLPEHTFDCSDIIGKVFEDKNRNGYEDGGEPGLPGARLATVNGVLITTDSHGRYHVGCADLPDQEIGSNFILKLDTRTLPTGYRVTTENPKTVRLTAGKITKLNFGASISRVIRFDLTDKLFVGSNGAMPPKLEVIVAKLVGILDRAPSVLRLTYYQGADGHDAAQKRMAAVQSLINKTWNKRSGRYELPVEAQIIGVK
jgi:fimbrial isopeptide formation D2 family protein